MNTATIILLTICAVVLAGLLAVYFGGRKMQKKQDEQRAELEAHGQIASILVIDKKKMKLKDAGFPDIVVKSAPRAASLAKLPIVKAKIGNKIQTLICEEDIFKVLPVKKECKVVVSGLYIIELKSVRGGMPVVENNKKGGLMAKLRGEQ
ncbi:MAG: hypothetical protein PUF77_04850 [Clostridiales bacterium]|nr:hypothetical protein [Clostridiales bacterium]